VLAVIVGIGSTLFAQFTAGFGGNQPTIENAMALVLGALALLGLGIFGPGIANGIVSGGPQLGAGAAVGTGLAAGGVVAAGAGLAASGAGLAGSAASGAGGASSALRAGSLSGTAKASASAPASPLRSAAARMAGSGRGGDVDDPSSTSSEGTPSWVRRMKRAQTISHGASAATQAVRSGDHGGSGGSVDLSQKDQ
jgi:type IV secretion system protein TrbL